MEIRRLSGNQLKLIALFCMTADHIGVMLLPQLSVLRILGRIAFPIFAYMIGEGCRYTRSMGKYLTALVLSAVLCQGVYLFAMGSLYMCIMVTFSLSVGLIWLVKLAKAHPGAWVLVIVGCLLAFFLAELLPGLLPGTDFYIDYGFVGILLPVLVYLLPERRQKLCAVILCLLLLSVGWKLQLWSLLSVPLLALYGGHRGKWKLKWLFYIYYPLHLVAIWLVGMLMHNMV